MQSLEMATAGLTLITFVVIFALMLIPNISVTANIAIGNLMMATQVNHLLPSLKAVPLPFDNRV